MSPPRALGPVAIPTCTPRMSAAWASWGAAEVWGLHALHVLGSAPLFLLPQQQGTGFHDPSSVANLAFGGVFIKLSVDFYIWGGGPFDKWNTHPWHGMDGCPLSGDTPKPT